MPAPSSETLSRTVPPAGQESPVLEMTLMGHDPPVLNGSGTGALTRRVYIADDHEGYRSGVARLVAEHPALEVVGQGADLSLIHI